MIPLWKSSPSYSLVMGFLLKMVKEVEGQQQRLTVVNETKPSNLLLLFKKAMLEVRKLNANNTVTIDTPPLQPKRHRFGNPLFKEAVKQICKVYETLIEEEIGIPFVKELFVNSFGSPIRIDYGTGHELTFLALLTVLDWNEKLLIGEASTFFMEYLLSCYHLQDEFNLEPAGSHGVFGLDDFHHIPFILGASQLVGENSPSFNPATITMNPVNLTENVTNFYSVAINRIYKKKKGPFHEHSPMLYDISALTDWATILRGLLKMYEGEVMSKYPIVQHFLFGDCLLLE